MRDMLRPWTDADARAAKIIILVILVLGLSAGIWQTGWHMLTLAGGIGFLVLIVWINRKKAP